MAGDGNCIKSSCNPAKTRLWVYIHSERWIHKKYIMALEDQIERQCFSGLEIQVTVIERFHLSRQYSPANFLEVYRSSMEVELKNFNMLEYNLFKRAQIAFPSDEQMNLTLPDSVISREKSGILVEYLEKFFVNDVDESQDQPAVHRDRREQISQKCCAADPAGGGECAETCQTDTGALQDEKEKDTAATEVKDGKKQKRRLIKQNRNQKHLRRKASVESFMEIPQRQ